MRSFAVAIVALSCIACDLSGNAQEVRTVPGGSAARGRSIVADGSFGCTACHAIPQMRGVRGNVGPSLDAFAARAFIGGQIPNTSANLVGFLHDPPGVIARTGMPNVNLSFADARDVAAYLYTLEPK